MCHYSKLAYLTDFLEAASSAAAPADREMACAKEAASVLATVTSTVDGQPAFQGMRV